MEDGLKAPAHGLVRAVDWEIDDIAEEDGDLCVSFRLDAPDGLPGWPHPAALRMLFRFGERLTLRLTSENLGSKPLVLSQALHTYFAVSAAARSPSRAWKARATSRPWRTGKNALSTARYGSRANWIASTSVSNATC